MILIIGIAVGSLFCQATKPLAFEVASVKANGSGAGPPAVRLAPNGNRLTAANATVRRLIMRAYSVADWQISGGPAWMDSEKYDIDAKPEKPTSSQELYAMLRNLLAERFKLTMHIESVERPLYALLVEKDEAKLKKHEAGQNDQEMYDWTDDEAGRHARFNNVPMRQFAFFLKVQTGRDVVDKTGLAGQYDFLLDFFPIRNPGDGGTTTPPEDAGGVGLQTAVRKQLGLKLESQKGWVERLHIDSVERPSEN